MTKLLLVLALVLSASATSFAQSERKRESLRGLHGVYLNIVPVKKEAQADGLSVSRIRNIVEARLRAAGIQIFSEPQAVDGDANLIVGVDTLKHPQGPHIFVIKISLIQMALLGRLPTPMSPPVLADTWSNSAMGLTLPNRWEIIDQPLNEKIGEFIEDFLAVNPPSKPTKR